MEQTTSRLRSTSPHPAIYNVPQSLSEAEAITVGIRHDLLRIPYVMVCTK